MHPDAEISIWERMVRVADRLWQHPGSKPYKRSQVDRALMAASIQTVDIASQTDVSDEFVALIHRLYAEEKAND